MFQKMTKATAHAVEIAVVLGILILLNILASDVFYRWDLTADKQYTIHRTSKDVVANLQDELRVTFYTSPELPTYGEQIRKDVLDLIEEYQAYANSNFVFREEHPDIKDDKEVQRLQMKGIMPIQVQQYGEGTAEIAKVYIGLLVSYGAKDPEVIESLDEQRGLEYRITRAIVKLTTEDMPTIGIFAGSGVRPLSQEGGYFGLGSVLRSQYPVQDVDLSRGDPVPDKVMSMIILNPPTFTSKEKVALDQFIMRGGRVIFFLDTVEIPLEQGLQARAKKAPTPWADFIGHYGLKIQPGLVGDLGSMARIPLRGMLIPPTYPLWPKVIEGYFGDLAFTTNLESITLPWASPVEYLGDKLGEDVEATYVFSSTEKAYLMEEPYNVNPDQFYSGTFQPPGEPQQYQFGVMLSGTFNSYYSGKEIPTVVNEDGVSEKVWDGELTTSGMPTELVLIGCSKAVSDMAIDPEGKSPNAIFLLNMVDSLNLGGGLTELRSRTVTDRPLKSDLTEGEKGFIKFSGIFLIPILLSLIGFGRYILRVQTKKLIEAKTLGLD